MHRLTTRLAANVALALLAGCAPPRDAPAATAPEVIVVGSGAGGGPLASRLARAGVRVLLLEAGEDVAARTDYRVPAMHALSTEDPAAAWWYFVRHHDEPGLDQADSKWTPDGILYPRGSALGGSTAVNAMVSVLPPPADWDRLAALTGDRGFRAAAMSAYLPRLAEWLPLELPDPQLALADHRVTDVLSAAATTYAEDAAGGGPTAAWDGSALASLLAADVNQRLASAEAEGVFRLPLATRDGARSGTRDLLRATVAAGFPLEIVTGAFVTGLVWDEAAATPTVKGVTYVRAAHVYAASLEVADAPVERLEARAEREVVLAAGAFNTPQLLLLSGVGDPTALAPLGIVARVALPGVGRNLQDRVEAPVVSELDADLPIVARCRLGEDADPCLDDWRAGAGVYRTSGFLATVLRRSAGAARPDLQIFATPGDARGYYPGYSRDALAHHDRLTWLLLKAHTRNRDGRVSLVDGSPFSRPRIHFHSYDEADPLHDPDLRALVDGVKFVRRAMARVPGGAPKEIWPGRDIATDDQLAAFLRRESWGHHACCTAPMGDGPDAVVDAAFRVRGTTGLRVVDASVFPEIPGTFIALPTYLLAERAADTLLEALR